MAMDQLVLPFAVSVPVYGRPASQPDRAGIPVYRVSLLGAALHGDPSATSEVGRTNEGVYARDYFYKVDPHQSKWVALITPVFTNVDVGRIIRLVVTGGTATYFDGTPAIYQPGANTMCIVAFESDPQDITAFEFTPYVEEWSPPGRSEGVQHETFRVEIKGRDLAAVAALYLAGKLNLLRAASSPAHTDRAPLGSAQFISQEYIGMTDPRFRASMYPHHII